MPLRILKATPYYPPHWGGMEVITSYVAHGLRQRGHHVKVVTTQTSKGQQEISDDPDLYRVPITFKVFNTPVSVKAYGLINRLAQGVDLIHAYAYPVFFSDVSAHVASKTKVPFVLEWTIDPRQAPAYKENMLAKIFTDSYMNVQGNRVFRKATVIITLSENYKRYLVSKGLPQEKIEVIPCGVDTELFNPKVSPISLGDNYESLILYVGRISSQKGLDLLLEAFPEILREHPNTLLAIIGLCDQPTFWRKIQSDLRNIKSHVKFFGSMSQDLLAKYYRTADLLVFPSRYESFAMVPLEASACGTPVVSTFAGAVEDATKKVAYLVENEKPSHLAKSVNYLLSNSDLRKKMGWQAAELVAKQYSWETALDKYEATYQKCLGA
jgi:glycosyltransferase involved in cell wall biosynthesis